MSDVLGAGQAVAKGIESVEAFLKTLFGPLATEVGLRIAEPLATSRAARAREIAASAARKVQDEGLEAHRLPPRVVVRWVESASVEDEPELQEKWASLLATAATTVGGPTLVSVYIDILRQLSPTEARMLDWMLDFYDSRRDPMKSVPMLDPRADYESNQFELGEFTEFEKSVLVLQLIFENFLRLRICEDQLDRNSFEASLKGQVLLGTRPQRVDGFRHDVIKLSPLGLAFLRACRFPGPSEEGERVPIS